MGSTSRMPKLNGSKVIGHAAPERMHQRLKMDDDIARGTRARVAASAPTTDAKKRRTRGQAPKSKP